MKTSKKQLVENRNSILQLLKSELCGSNADLVDELLDEQKAKDETRRMNVLDTLSCSVSESQMDLVDDLLEADALVNPA